MHDDYLIRDIAAIRQLHQDLTISAKNDSLQTSPHIQESKDSPILRMMMMPPSQTPNPVQGDFSFGHKFHPHPYIQTPISANVASPSTAASSNGPSIWTPISAHSISPATATESHFASPYRSMCWPLPQQTTSTTITTSHTTFSGETSHTHPNFPLPINNDYDLLSNEFLQDDASLFASTMNTITSPTKCPMAMDVLIPDLEHEEEQEEDPEDPEEGAEDEEEETIASLSCHICHITFSGKEQFLASNRRRHMRELHSPMTKASSCGVCDKSFKRKHNLSVHLKTVHAERRG